MTTPPLHSVILNDLGLALFGPEWAAPMARLTATHERTIRRIRAAAAEGREYPAARGVLAALHEALVALEATLRPYGRS
jgi:hypothetical protein